MTKLERVFITIILLFVAVCAIAFIGANYYALLAVFDLFVGVLIGMVLSTPNSHGEY